MDIRELLLKDAMIMDLKASTKEEAISEMVHQYFVTGVINDEDLYKKDIVAREKQSTTGIGDGIAMPHAKDKAVQRATVLFAKSEKGVDYDALDGNPVHLFFMIAAPEGANNTHLQALATLSGLLIDPTLVAKLKQAQTPDEVHQLFADAQAQKEEKDQAEEKKEQQQAAAPASSDRPYVVAVTACPTGIAHTYMAEEALKKQAEAMGVDIKVETNGSEGVKHLLTAAEIARLFASDQVALDPHTAVASRVAKVFQETTQDQHFTVVVSTASPYKFAQAVLVGLHDPNAFIPGLEAVEALQKRIGVPLPPTIARLFKAPVRTKKIVEPQEMEAAVKEILSIK